MTKMKHIVYHFNMDDNGCKMDDKNVIIIPS